MSEPIHSGIGKILVEVMDEQRDALATARAEVNAVRRTLAAQLSELERISDALGMKEGHSSVDHIVAMKAKMAAQRTALLALAERIRRAGMQGVANEIEEIVKA